MLAGIDLQGAGRLMRRVALLLALASTAAACGGSSVLNSTSGTNLAEPPSPTTDTSDAGWPQGVVTAYLDGCAEDPADDGYCRCTIREFEQRITLDEFLDLEGGDLSAGVVLDVATVCLEETGMLDNPLAGLPEIPRPVPDDLKGYTDLTIDVIEAYWAATLPGIYGIAYEDVAETIPYFPSTGNLPECGPDELPLDVYEENAFYCHPGDYVAWDAEGLMPGLYAEFGDFAVALVLAHEWGHAIQARASVVGLGIMTELQADCFAGAWGAHVDGGGSNLLHLQAGDLEEAMAGYLLFRDPPGTSPGDEDAHGSAFDRVNAFQDGFFNGPDQCATYEDGEFFVVAIPLTPEDRVTGGDLPFAETAPLLAATLETFWSAVFPVLFDTEYTPMTDYGPYLPSTGVLPPCGPVEIDPEEYLYNAFYCPDGDFVAWDNENLFPSLWQEIGDFAIGMVLAHEWATGAQVRAGLPTEGLAASLQADCFTGSWTSAMVDGIPIVLADDSETAIALSAGDLDEAVAGFLLFGDEPGDGEPAAGTAFKRFNAFQDGFFNGVEQCLDYTG